MQGNKSFLVLFFKKELLSFPPAERKLRVADRMERWMEQGAADGFMIQATHLAGAFTEFAAQVVPGGTGGRTTAAPAPV